MYSSQSFLTVQVWLQHFSCQGVPTFLTLHRYSMFPIGCSLYLPPEPEVSCMQLSVDSKQWCMQSAPWANYTTTNLVVGYGGCPNRLPISEAQLTEATGKIFLVCIIM